MKPSINLATRRIIQKKTLRKFFLSSIIFFGLGVSLTLGLLLINFFINLQISNLNDTKSDLEAQIVRQKSVKDKLLMVQERVGRVRNLLTTRDNAGEKINFIVAAIPSSIEISSIQYDEEGINFALKSSSLADLQGFIEKDIPSLQESGNKDIGAISINAFKLDPDNFEYLLNFSVGQVSKNQSSVQKVEITQ